MPANLQRDVSPALLSDGPLNIYFRVRNWGCGVLALVLIASGYVRRARKRALSGDVVTAVYFHSPNRRLFARCVRWLSANGYTFVSLGDVLAWLHSDAKIPKGAVWLSFDDGRREILTNALPVAQRYKIPITLFVPSGILEGNGRLPWLHSGPRDSGSPASRDTLTVDELQELALQPGISLGSHTVNHRITASLSEKELCYEIGDSKRAIESWISSEVNCFAYPVGVFDGREKTALMEYGYVMAATTQSALIARNVDPYSVPRFSVADQISYPEAICNLVGAWRPFIDSLIGVAKRLRRLPQAKLGG